MSIIYNRLSYGINEIEVRYFSSFDKIAGIKMIHLLFLSLNLKKISVFLPLESLDLF